MQPVLTDRGCLYEKHQVEFWTALAFRWNISMQTPLKDLRMCGRSFGINTISLKGDTGALWHTANRNVFKSTACWSKRPLANCKSMLLAGSVLRTSQLYVFESLMVFDIKWKPVGKGQILGVKQLWVIQTPHHETRGTDGLAEQLPAEEIQPEKDHAVKQQRHSVTEE